MHESNAAVAAARANERLLYSLVSANSTERELGIICRRSRRRRRAAAAADDDDTAAADTAATALHNEISVCICVCARGDTLSVTRSQGVSVR